VINIKCLFFWKKTLKQLHNVDEVLHFYQNFTESGPMMIKINLKKTLFMNKGSLNFIKKVISHDHLNLAYKSEHNDAKLNILDISKNIHNYSSYKRLLTS
jgi:hypothetical protein